MTTMVKMQTLPDCDFCGKTAGYDAKTVMGPWAYMCQSCFDLNGAGSLGLGWGQRLVLENAEKSEKTARRG